VEANKLKAKIIIVPKQTKLENYNESQELMRTAVVVAAAVAAFSVVRTVIQKLKISVLLAVQGVLNVVAVNMKSNSAVLLFSIAINAV
jgi:hypothetical protein